MILYRIRYIYLYSLHSEISAAFFECHWKHTFIKKYYIFIRHKVHLESALQFEHFCVDSPYLHERVMIPFLNDLTMVKDNDLICLLNGLKSMSDNNDRASVK